MTQLTEKDRRTVRLAAMGIGIYLALFAGFRGVAFLEVKRTVYEKMVARAQNLEREVRPIENRVLLLEKLKQRSRVDPARWSRTSLVAEASAAIQKAAAGGGVQMGPMREMPGRPSARELSSISIEGTGPIQPMLELIPKIEMLGFPLVVDSVQFAADPMRPGMLKVNLTVTILDIEQWKNDGEVPRA